MEQVASSIGRSRRDSKNRVGREQPTNVDEASWNIALRTAFVSRFIVLREGRRSRAHRSIEDLSWLPETTAEELAKRIRETFVANGDKLQPVDRDIRRAMEHARCSIKHFVEQYVGRATLSFREALNDYQKSNQLLFGEETKSVCRSGGWRLSDEL